MWRRIKNLWLLSNYEPIEFTKKIPATGIIFPGFPEVDVRLTNQPSKLAQIIKKPQDPLELANQ